jgi:hypothetical protein
VNDTPTHAKLFPKFEDAKNQVFDSLPDFTKLQEVHAKKPEYCSYIRLEDPEICGKSEEFRIYQESDIRSFGNIIANRTLGHPICDNDYKTPSVLKKQAIKVVKEEMICCFTGLGEYLKKMPIRMDDLTNRGDMNDLNAPMFDNIQIGEKTLVPKGAQTNNLPNALKKEQEEKKGKTIEQLKLKIRR